MGLYVTYNWVTNEMVEDVGQEPLETIFEDQVRRGAIADNMTPTGEPQANWYRIKDAAALPVEYMQARGDIPPNLAEDDWFLRCWVECEQKVTA